MHDHENEALNSVLKRHPVLARRELSALSDAELDHLSDALDQLSLLVGLEASRRLGTPVGELL